MNWVLACTAGASTSSAFGAGATDIDAAMAELDMEHYDSEDDGAAGPKVNLFGSGKAYYRGSREDPYLKGGGAGDSAEDSDDDASERNELHLRPSDLLILSARNEDDVSHLEVRRGLLCVHVWAPVCISLVFDSCGPGLAEMQALHRCMQADVLSLMLAADWLGEVVVTWGGVRHRCGCMRRRTRPARPTCTCTTTLCCPRSRSRSPGWTATPRGRTRPATWLRCAPEHATGGLWQSCFRAAVRALAPHMSAWRRSTVVTCQTSSCGAVLESQWWSCGKPASGRLFMPRHHARMFIRRYVAGHQCRTCQVVLCDQHTCTF